MAKHPKPARSRKPAPGDGTLPKVRPIRPLKLSRLKLHSVRDRSHLSQLDRFARLTQPRASFAEWFGRLAGLSRANKFRAAVDAIVTPRQGRQASRVRTWAGTWSRSGGAAGDRPHAAGRGDRAGLPRGHRDSRPGNRDARRHQRGTRR